MITIIPDIHGRVFWKKAVDSASKDDTIVFLGDYLICTGWILLSMTLLTNLL